MIRLATALALLAGPAFAQAMPDPAPHMAVLRVCLDASEDRAGDETCRGVVYEACELKQAEGERYTTIGMSMCSLTEAAAWDVLLNEDWARLRQKMQAQDKDDGGTRDEMLLKAQRAWIAFRDADCAFEVAKWGQGSMRQIAGAACRASATAAREMDFRDSLREGQ